MSSLLQQALQAPALENQETSPDPSKEATLLMKGPLSDIYTKALYLTYGKDVEDDAERKIENAEVPEPAVAAVMESLQMDGQILKTMAKMVTPAGSVPQTPPQSVYTVSKRGVDEQTVIEVTTELAQYPTDRRGDFLIVIDAVHPGNGNDEQVVQERWMRMGAALEQMVEAMGGTVYHSLPELLQAYPVV